MNGDGPERDDSSIGEPRIGGSSNDDSSGRNEPSPPECPHCGERMTWFTVVGPGEGYASPCGCEIAPGLLANFRED